MAGSWEEIQTGIVHASGGDKSRLSLHEVEFEADAADASVPVLQVGLESSSGLLQRLTVKFDGTTPPAGASFTVQVADANGILIGNAAGDALTDSSDIVVNKVFMGPLYVHVSGNTTNSAKAVVSLYVIG